MSFGLGGLFATISILAFAMIGPLILHALNRISKNFGYVGMTVFASCCICCTINAQKRGESNNPAMKIRRNIRMDGVDVAFNGTNCDSGALLEFTHIEASTNFVDFTMSCLANDTDSNSFVDLYGSHTLSAIGWQHLGGVFVDSTNVCMTIPFSSFHTNSMCTTAFFKAAVRMDSDKDGCSDATEEWVYGTHPFEVDTDHDGLPDGWEIEHQYDPKDAGMYTDSDGDGLADMFELSIGSNPMAIDSDGDGLSDWLELKYDANPLLSDTDGDGVSDGLEYEWGTDPKTFDDCYSLDPGSASNADYVYFDDETNAMQISVGMTSVSNVNYQMVGSFDCTVNFDSDYTSDFSILGMSPPSGTTVLPGDFVGETWYNVSAPGWKDAFDFLATGARFKPLKTGRYSFQAYADDSVMVTIGDVRPLMITADYYGANNVTSAIFVAGLEYPVRIAARNDGGPTELRFPIWGEFEAIERPSVKITVSDDVVIFEPSYENIPGHSVVPSHSSEISINIQVKGGELGGQLTTTGNILSHLQRVRGDECVNVNRRINPYEVVNFHGVYCANERSSATNDVAVVASVVEDLTAEEFSCTSTVTIACVEVSSSFSSQLSHRRHVFGPLETANIHVSPEGVQNEKTIMGASSQQGIGPQIDSNGVFTASSLPSCVDVRVKCGNNASITLPMRTIAPREVRGGSAVRASDSDWAAHDAGSPVEMWCAMKIPICAVPKFVSFDNVEFLEETAIPKNCWGVFVNAHAGILPHRANSWSCNGDGDIYDFAAISGLQMANGWQDGGYEYQIPQYWRPISGAPTWYWVTSHQVVLQKHNVDRDGTVSISKFGNIATRYTNGYYYVIRSFP